MLKESVVQKWVEEIRNSKQKFSVYSFGLPNVSFAISPYKEKYFGYD